MMKLHFSLPAALALAATLLTGGCGNESSATDVTSTVVQQLRGLVQRKPAAPAITPALVAQALAGTEGPMEMITREDTQTSALLLRIESSRGYETFGSADRRTITMNGGLLTATRGLGGDLMSTDLSQVGPLIKSRRAGQATRTIYVLDGEDRTLAIPLACSVSPGGTVPVKAGALNTTARQVTETCTGDALKVTNIYLIDGKGRAVSSKQWAGPYIGYVLMQTLRQ